MTYKERLLKALRREPVDRSPVAVPTQNATVAVMEKAGVFWPDAQRAAGAMTKLALACQRVYGFESVRLPFDINVEAETMGRPTRYGGESDPPMSEPATREQLAELRYPDPATGGRMAEVVKAVGMTASEKDPDTPLIAALGTPFEVLCTVYNFDQMYDDLKSAPERLEDLLEKILEMQINYAGALVAAGADVVMLVDGTSQTLMPKHFARFSMPYTKKLRGAISLPAILHICGNPSRLIAQMVETGADALSLDAQVRIPQARDDSGGKVAFVGALDVNVMHSGSPDDVRRMVRESKEAGMDIIAPGCGIMPTTPLENVLAYVDEVKSPDES